MMIAEALQAGVTLPTMTSAPTMAERCAVCGGARAEALKQVVDPQSQEVFSIERCTSCGLGHTVPQPQDIGTYYGSVYHGRRHGFTAQYSDRRRLRFVDAVRKPDRKTSLLDVGCGDGTFLLSAQKRGWTATGTELNPGIARKQGLAVGETLDEVGDRGPFDVITFWHTLEHMRDPSAMLAQARALLAPEGVVLIAVPNAGSLQATLFGARWFHLDVPRHLFHFSEKSLARLLQQVELKIARRWSQELEIGLFGWTQSALNALMPSSPNVLYSVLTGRPSVWWQAIASTVLGSAVTAAALPVELAASANHASGTLVVAATTL